MKAMEPAILKAISDESTVWKEPSIREALKSTTGYPATTPSAIASTMPFSTAGMYCRGMTPPTILSANSKPLPRGRGSISSQASPYWPRPPDCFLYFPWIVVLPLIVSLYGTLGVVRLTSTPNFLLSLSIVTSMWTWPIPERMISFVWSSLWMVIDGSSSRSLLSELMILSSSPFVLGWTANDMMGVMGGTLS